MAWHACITMLCNLDKKGTQRVFYMNAMYFVFGLICSLLVYILDAPYGEGDDAKPRYQVCALNQTGIGDSTKCPGFNGENKEQMLAIWGIVLAGMIMNIVLFAWSIINHCDREEGSMIMTYRHLGLQWIFAAVNLGLMVGLYTWVILSEGAQDEANKDNVYFADGIDIVTASIVGIVFGVVDVLFNILFLIERGRPEKLIHFFLPPNTAGKEGTSWALKAKETLSF